MQHSIISLWFITQKFGRVLVVIVHLLNDLEEVPPQREAVQLAHSQIFTVLARVSAAASGLPPREITLLVVPEQDAHLADLLNSAPIMKIISWLHRRRVEGRLPPRIPELMFLEHMQRLLSPDLDGGVVVERSGQVLLLENVLAVHLQRSAAA